MRQLLVFSSPCKTPCREAWVELMLLLLDGMLERVEHLRGDLEGVGSLARFVDFLDGVGDSRDLLTPFPHLSSLCPVGPPPRPNLSKLPCMGPSSGQPQGLCRCPQGRPAHHFLSWRSGRQGCQQGASGDQGVLLSGRVERREGQGWSLEEELASCQGELLGCRGGLRAPNQGENSITGKKEKML